MNASSRLSRHKNAAMVYAALLNEYMLYCTKSSFEHGIVTSKGPRETVYVNEVSVHSRGLNMCFGSPDQYLLVVSTRYRTAGTFTK